MWRDTCYKISLKSWINAETFTVTNMHNTSKIKQWKEFNTNSLHMNYKSQGAFLHHLIMYKNLNQAETSSAVKVSGELSNIVVPLVSTGQYPHTPVLKISRFQALEGMFKMFYIFLFTKSHLFGVNVRCCLPNATSKRFEVSLGSNQGIFCLLGKYIGQYSMEPLT